jgi:hypothetical protein
VLVILESVNVDGYPIVKINLLARRYACMDLGRIVFADPANL